MLYAAVKHWGCCANPGNEKAEIAPKSRTKKVQTKSSHSGLNADCFITLTDSPRLASAPAPVFTSGEMGTEVWNGSLRSLCPLHGFWLFLRGITSSAHEMHSFVWLVLLLLRALDFLTLPALQEWWGWSLEAASIAVVPSLPHKFSVRLPRVRRKEKRWRRKLRKKIKNKKKILKWGKKE